MQQTVVYSENRSYARIRRALNTIVASAALLLSLPLMAVCCLAIAIEDGFPVLFRQQRVGRFERRFVMYKLRTMKKTCCGDAPSPSGPADTRITRIGRLLRKTSIDELPQLINVLKGDMSIVGPRPEMPFIVERYEGWQHVRHLVEPGITGLWQTTHRSNIPLDRPEATLLDLEYINSASLRTDGALVAQTFKALLSANGAY